VDAKRSDGATLTLPSDREIRIVRSFRAPKSLLFEMWSKPEHVQRWYACDTMSMPTCEMDFRVGGKWRWVLCEPKSGTLHPLSGEYREIASPDRLVFSERYEPVPGSDHLVTLTFAEATGVTTLTQTFLHSTKKGRDGHLQSGMTEGLDAMFERIDVILQSLR